MENLFELAARTKMRFTFKGVISVEDLWDLNVQSLDSIYKELKAKQKLSQEESLLSLKTAANKELDAKIEIVKHIVLTKQNEQRAILDTKKKKEERQKIMDAIARKKDQNLENMSLEDLEKELAKDDQ